MANVKKTGSSPAQDKKGHRQTTAFSVIRPNAAGIDIGQTIHAVAVPAGSVAEGEPSVRSFAAMTCDLEQICAWLKDCRIDTVAMESTGVYWKPLFSLLVRNGFEVYLVNARNVKNVTGRKTDESDAAWLQKLHSCGLLQSSYLPDDEQDALRTLVRLRKTMVQEASRSVLRMQKACELMNIKLHTVISDITGKTGIAIVEAILAGERQPSAFLALVGPRIKADHAVIEKSLQGTWREEHLFALRESYLTYKFFRERMAACDAQIELQLQTYEAKRNEGLVQTHPAATEDRHNKKAKDKNHPRFDTRSYLQRILGVDVLAIYGLSENSGLQILAETGTDMGKWPTEKHFVSWLNLCPNNKISGGKLISSRIRRGSPSLAGQAFRAAANAVQKSDHWLGDYFRRMKAKGGNKYAIVATANKLATIYYKMVSTKTAFNPPALADYQEHRKKLKINYLERKLRQLKGEGLD